jgi:hypothetical protein
MQRSRPGWTGGRCSGPSGSTRPGSRSAWAGPTSRSWTGTGAQEGFVEELPLLVAHVHEEALLVPEVVDDPDHVPRVALLRARGDVLQEALLSPVAHLPLLEQVLHPEAHPEEGPPEKR